VIDFPSFLTIMTMVVENELGLRYWKETDLLKGVDVIPMKRGLNMSGADKFVQLLNYQADRAQEVANKMLE